MRKFVITILLLAAVGGTVFFIGWTSFLIGPEEYGVIFTKTGGWNHPVVEPGGFSWHWERLLPTNLTMYRFELEDQRSTISLHHTLPSGEHYAKYLEGTPDFRFLLTAEVRWGIDPQRLPHLAQTIDLRPDNSAFAYDDAENRLKYWVQNILIERVTDEAESSAHTMPVKKITDGLAAEVSENLEDTIIRSLSVQEIQFPDISLYRAGQELYAEMTESRREAIQQANAAALFEELIADRQLEALRTYGEVITEYPLLLEYFTLSAQNNTDPLRLDRMGGLIESGILDQ